MRPEELKVVGLTPVLEEGRRLFSGARARLASLAAQGVEPDQRERLERLERRSENLGRPPRMAKP